MKKRSTIIIAIFVALIVAFMAIALSSGMLQPSIAEKTDISASSQASVEEKSENSVEISVETESSIIESENTSNVSEVSKKNELSSKESSDNSSIGDTSSSSSKPSGNNSSSSSKPSGSNSGSSSSSSSSKPSGGTSSGSSSSSSSSSASSHSHSYSSKTVKATCTSDGYTVHTCSCGASYTDNYTSATGHKWSDWKTVKKATTSSEGKKQRTCSSCGKTESKTIAKVSSSSSIAGEHKITGARKAVYSYNGDHGDTWSSVNLVDLINEERVKEGLCKLEWTADGIRQSVVDDPDLLYCYDRSCFDANGHFDPYLVAEVKEPLEGAQKMADMGFATHGYGVGCSCVGECRGAETIEEALKGQIKAYMNSSGHRAILMNAGSHSVTASYAIDSNGTVYTAIRIGG